MTEDDRFRDYAAPGGDFTWSPPSRNGQGSQSPQTSQDDDTQPVRAGTVLTGGGTGGEPGGGAGGESGGGPANGDGG
ncbi:hypothetical protein ACFQ08_35840, partial [Streptosporangium algeriense]